MQIALIAALDRRFAIGMENRLPWHLPEDLARFKRLTLNQTVLMGRKTAESLGRALPKRRNLVLTRSGRVPFAGMAAVSSIDQALSASDSETLWIIGGGEVYRLGLALADIMFLTHVETELADADTYFPEFPATDWQVHTELALPADARHAFSFRFVDYRRRHHPLSHPV